jgi:hypothetical protein
LAEAERSFVCAPPVLLLLYFMRKPALAVGALDSTDEQL